MQTTVGVFPARREAEAAGHPHCSMGEEEEEEEEEERQNTRFIGDIQHVDGETRRYAVFTNIGINTLRGWCINL